MNAESRIAHGVLTQTSPLREVWPEGLVPLRVYRGRKVFDVKSGRIVESGTVYELDVRAVHHSIREQLALLMSRAWGWDFRQALLLLEADGEFPINEAEHLAGTIFKGSELQPETRKG